MATEIVDITTPDIIETSTPQIEVIEVSSPNSQVVEVTAPNEVSVSDTIVETVEVFNPASGLSRGIGGGVPSGGNPFTNTSVPPIQIVGLSADGGLTSISLSWARPDYFNHSHTEIWRNSADDRDNALPIGVATVDVYSDPVGIGETYFYWVRPVSLADIAGSWNGTAGTSATTGTDASALVTALNDKITSSQLHADLTTSIDKIDINETAIQTEVTARLQAIANEETARTAAILTETTTRESAEGVIASDITKLQITAPLGGNMLDMSAWKIGNTGTAIGDTGGIFVGYGQDSENSINLEVGPDGSTQPVWEASSITADNEDGGWNYVNIPVDEFMTYRSIVWIRKFITTDGSTYFGCSTGDTMNLNDTANTNPYFLTGDLPQVDKWYMLVGIIHGSGYTGAYSGVAGVYDPASGVKVQDSTEFKMKPGSVYQTHRSYLYATTTDSVVQQFARPRFEVLNGTEPTVETLLTTRERNAYIEQTLSVVASDVDGINAQWTVKTDVNNRIAGVGLMNTGVTSIFEIIADNFAVLDPNDLNKVVLGTVGGNAVMDGAYINNLDANKINATELSAIVANLGTITAGKMQSADGNMVIDLDAKRIFIQ